MTEKRSAKVAAVLILASAALALAALVWELPRWQMSVWPDDLPWEDQLLVENELRRTLILSCAGIAVLASLYFLWRRARAAELAAEASMQMLAAAQAGSRRERLGQALQQLVHENLEVRLAAIYLLELLAKESDTEHGAVMEVLGAYVRRRVAWDESRPSAPAVPVEVQAALKVLGRRERGHDRDGQVIDLSRTDLRGADLKGMQLQGVCLAEAHLEGASMEGVQLDDADLRQAVLTGADLVGASLRGAKLREAWLDAAYLVEAHLEKADLGDAHLEGAYLGGAFLEGADLGGAHLDGAYIYKAHLNGASLHGARVLSAIGMTRSEREAIHRSSSEAASAFLDADSDRDRVHPGTSDDPGPTAKVRRFRRRA